jgi:hypothetical protein
VCPSPTTARLRGAVAVLLQALDRADRDRGQELLGGVPGTTLYEAGVTVMMRLVFLLYAEQQALPPGDSLGALRDGLRAAADKFGEAFLEGRYDAWHRLIAYFRTAYAGFGQVPACGGLLFDPDRFAFLEGRRPGTSWRDAEANPLPVNDRTVLYLLETLQALPARGKDRVGAAAWDVEQVGRVYEALLDGTPRRATAPCLGLAGTRHREPVISLAELEELRGRGEKYLLAFLAEETGRTERALKKALRAAPDETQAGRLRAACQGDEGLWTRVQPFAALARLDPLGNPAVFATGSVFVTADSGRRNSGTHYTPRSLTEMIVQATLEPLVYVGPAEGKPKEDWRLRPARELLDVKICDPACGCGAFLVQACRYLSERLVEAWAEGDGAALPGLKLPLEPAERQTCARRLVAQRCLYGVDSNPLAVEMAKLSLRLFTLARGRPPAFLDHAIRCGDALVGIHDLDPLNVFDRGAEDGDLFAGLIGKLVDEAAALRQKVRAWPGETAAAEKQEHLLAQAEEKTARLRSAADLLLAAELRGGRTFHWPLEFPEVLGTASGFDAVVGNPPWGQKAIRASPSYREHLQRSFPSARGIFDLFRPFVERGVQLLRRDGCIGLVLPDIVLLKNYPRTRKFLLDALTLLRLGWHGRAFAGAAIDTATLVGRKAPAPAGHHFAATVAAKETPSESLLLQSRLCRPPAYVFNLHLDDARQDRLDRFKTCPRLGNYFEVHEGVHSGNVRGELFVDRPLDATCRELFFGRDELRPYALRWAGSFIRLSALPAHKALGRYANPGRPHWFAQAKVLVRRTGDRVLAAVDESGRYASNNFFVVFPRRRCALDLHGLVALLNSHFMTWYFRAVVPRQGRAFAELKIHHLGQFPLPLGSGQHGNCGELNRLGRQRSACCGRGQGAAEQEVTLALDRAIDAAVGQLFGIDGCPEGEHEGMPETGLP